MISKLKNSLTVTSVLYFVLGVFMLIFPEVISDFICYLVSLMFMFFGIAAVLMYVRSEIKTPYTSTILVLGIVLGSLGIYIIINPRIFASLIPLSANHQSSERPSLQVSALSTVLLA